MLIKLYDYKGVSARQILGNTEFVIDTEKKSCVIFINNHEIEITHFYDCETTIDCVSIYLYEDAQEGLKERINNIKKETDSCLTIINKW